MATVSNTLQLNDKISPVLSKILKSMQSMMNLMQEIDKNASSGIVSDEFERLQGEINAANNDLLKLNNTLSGLPPGVEKAGKGFESWQGFIVAANAALSILSQGMSFVNRSFTALFGAGMEIERMRGAFVGMFGDAQAGAYYFEQLQMRANESAFSFESMATSAQQFISITKDFGQLDEMINITERIAAANPQRTFEDAGLAFVKAYQGQYRMLEEGFNIVINQADRALLKSSKDMDDWLENMNEVMGGKGISADLVDSLNNTVSTQLELMKSNFSTGIGNAAQAGLQALMPLITGINEFFASDTGVQFFSMVEDGIMQFATALGNVLNIAMQVATFIINNWTEIASLITPIVVGLGVWKAAQIGVNIAMLANPIGLVIVGVVALIAIIYKAVDAYNEWANTSISVGQSLMAVMFTVGAYISNVVLIPLWNMFASFANFIGNVFDSPLASVQILFLDWSQNIVGYVANAVRAIEGMINLLPFVDVNLTSGIDKFQNSIVSKSQEIKDASGWKEFVEQKDYIDYAEAATKGYTFFDRSAGTNDLEDILGPTFKPDEWGQGPTGMPNDPVSVKGTVDISNTSLEYLRDIAKVDFINRYQNRGIEVPDITLNGIREGGQQQGRSVIVQQEINNNVQFGDVRENADVEGIIEMFEKSALEAYNAGLEG